MIFFFLRYDDLVNNYNVEYIAGGNLELLLSLDLDVNWCLLL